MSIHPVRADHHPNEPTNSWLQTIYDAQRQQMEEMEKAYREAIIHPLIHVPVTMQLRHVLKDAFDSVYNVLQAKVAGIDLPPRNRRLEVLSGLIQ
jgi:hypothetical protein